MTTTKKDSEDFYKMLDKLKNPITNMQKNLAS